MSKAAVWVSAARLRTLPLSISGILVGSALAYEAHHFDWKIFVLAVLTTLGFQILSNFANDYGDGVKGTDSNERVGPMRAMQSGLLSANELKRGVIICAVLTLFVAILLIYAAFGSDNFLYSLLFFILGLASVTAAIKYTVGESAYGYKGLGDLFVFIFFGLLAVAGSYFLYTNQLNATIFLPAVTIGLWSTAVLNLNNMRDRIPDARSNKNTLVVYLGEKQAKLYHYTIIITGFVSLLVYFLETQHWRWAAMSSLVVFPLGKHLYTVYKNDSPALLDPELKVVALSTFFFSILFFIGYVV